MTTLSPSSFSPLLAVAGLSARMLAQSARRAGLRVAALDLFGDRDTRAASTLWLDVGGPNLSVDRGKLVDGLRRIGRLPRVAGWIAGSGTEPLVDELSETRGLPPLIGNGAPATVAVREPHRFFALLDALGIPHPEVSFARPIGPGWLFKHADGCGGTHIVPSDGVKPADAPHGYYQRSAGGRSCSALFVAARGSCTVLGFAEQFTADSTGLPFVHTGSIGPIALPVSVSTRIGEAIGAICRNSALVGINSCDFLLDGDAFALLEINARPSATMALYEAAWRQRWPRGLVACHLDACAHGRLPSAPSVPAPCCAGQEVLFATHGFTCSSAFSDACLADPGCRDVPMPGSRVEAGQPLCTLVACAPSPAAVRSALEHQRTVLAERIDTFHPYAFVLLASHA